MAISVELLAAPAARFGRGELVSVHYDWPSADVALGPGGDETTAPI